jgi:hypothetical protein
MGTTSPLSCHDYKFQEMWMSVKFLSVSWVRFVLHAKAQIATCSSQRKTEEQVDRVSSRKKFFVASFNWISTGKALLFVSKNTKTKKNQKNQNSNQTKPGISSTSIC